MRPGLLIVALLALLGLTNCGGADEPLTASEYRAAGNEICADWSAKISELSGGLSNDTTQQELLVLNNEIAQVADDYTERLLDLGTPDALAGDRAMLQTRINEYEALTENVPQTEEEVDAITDAGNAITDALGTLWSGCRTPS